MKKITYRKLSPKTYVKDFNDAVKEYLASIGHTASHLGTREVWVATTRGRARYGITIAVGASKKEIQEKLDGKI